LAGVSTSVGVVISLFCLISANLTVLSDEGYPLPGLQFLFSVFSELY
jgi:hypothetical protein